MAQIRMGKTDGFTNFKSQAGGSPPQTLLKKKGPGYGTNSPDRRTSAQRMSAQTRNSGQLLAGMNIVQGGTPRLKKVPGGFGSPNLDETLPGTAPLLAAADEEIESFEKLRTEVLYNRLEAQEHRYHLAEEVTELLRVSVIGLKREKDSLENVLVQKLEQIHHFELSKMDVEVTLRRRRKNQKAIAVQHLKLQKGDNTKVDLCSTLEAEHNGLRDVIKGLNSDLHAHEDRLNELYADKERLESQIAEKRHAITINDAMHRARPDKPRIKPGIPTEIGMGMTF